MAFGRPQNMTSGSPSKGRGASGLSAFLSASFPQIRKGRAKWARLLLVTQLGPSLCRSSPRPCPSGCYVRASNVPNPPPTEDEVTERKG